MPSDLQVTSFLAMASGSLGPQFGPELPFWAHLKQHLTELSLRLSPGKSAAQNLAGLGMLTALKKLDVGAPICFGYAHHDISRETLVWKLPHLTRLQVNALTDGELVLACPKLAEAYFVKTRSLGIRVEDAALAWLTMTDCQSIQCAFTSPGKQLQDLKALKVTGCSEVGRHLIEDVGLMRRLGMLTYKEFPSASMPKEFPHSLFSIDLAPTDWRLGLPGGLKELPKLSSFTFESGCDSWWPRRPMYEHLPVERLTWVRGVGANVFRADELATLRELWRLSKASG